MAKSIGANLETKKHEEDVGGEEKCEALEVVGAIESVGAQGNTEWDTRRAGAMAARLLADVHIHVPNGG